MHKLFNITEFATLGRLKAQFIETGSYHGEGIKAALDAGFTHIQSIEIDKDRSDHCRAMFKDRPEVICLHGSSDQRLEEMLKSTKVDQPLFIWLDAHINLNSESFDPTCQVACPLYEELSMIAAFNFPYLVIAIDDMRIIEKDGWGINILKTKLIEYAKKAIPNAKISYANGEVENDIMVITQ